MKKFLSLVLALVMAMSLVTVSAGAADFTDDSTITYAEAVDVISEIGVVDGYTDGSFNPTANLTRGAASKIICNLILGSTTASALSADSAPYSDVPVSNVFSGYIAYCQKEGIISGYADGTFRPADPLTGYAFMKMLLGALGYDSEIEGFTGANWSVNVAKKAIGIGLDEGNDNFVGTQAVNREEACLYAFNMIQSDMVEYENKTTVVVGDSTVTVGGSNAKSRYWESSSTADGNILKDNIVQFAEEYFNKLEKTADIGDDFGRPANRWDYKGVKIGTYAETPDLTYVGSVKVNQIYSDLNMSTKDASGTLYINGVNFTEYNDKSINTFEVSKSNDTKLSSKAMSGETIGDGTIVEVYHDDDTNDVTIVAISVYGGKIAAVKDATSKKDAYVVVEAGTPNLPKSFNDSSDNREYETEEFTEDDVVAFTYSDSAKEIKTMYKMEPVSGKLDERVVDKSLTLDGTLYKYAKEVTFDSAMSNGQDDLSYNSEYAVYRDENGLALWIEEAEFSIGNYAYVVRITGDSTKGTTSMWDGNRAKLVFADGTPAKIVTLAKDYILTVNGGIKAGDIVTYSVDNSGNYKLNDIADTHIVTNYTGVTNDTDISDGVTGITSFSIANKTISGLKNVSADSKTVFAVEGNETTGTNTYGNDDFDFYSGIKNAPTVYDVTSGTKTIAAAYVSDGTAKVIFILGGESVSTSKDITFIAGQSVSKMHTSNTDNTEYYVYNAVVKGEITTVMISADAADAANVAPLTNRAKLNIIWNTTASDDGIITSGKYNDTYTLVRAYDDSTKSGGELYVGVKKISSDEIKVDGAIQALATNCNFYMIDEDGVITKVTLDDIKTDADDTVCYTMEDGEITNLFVQEVSSKASAGSIVNDGDRLNTVLNGSELSVASADIASNGRMTMELDYVAPAFAAATTTVTLEIDVKENGKYYDTLNLTGNVRDGSAEINYKSGTKEYDPEATYTFSVVDETLGAVKVQYVVEDAAGKTLAVHMNDASDATDYTKNVASDALKFKLDSNYYTSVNGLSYSISGLTKNAVTGTLETDGSKAVTSTALGTDYVVVTITGAATKAPDRTIKTDTDTLVKSAGAAISTFKTAAGATNTSTDTLKLVVTNAGEFNDTADTFTVAEGTKVNFGIQLSGVTASNVVAYVVAVTIDGETYTNTLDGTTKSANLGTLTVSKDLEIDAADITVTPVTKNALTDVSYDADNLALTLTFRDNIKASSADATTLGLANLVLDPDHDISVSGNQVTIYLLAAPTATSVVAPTASLVTTSGVAFDAAKKVTVTVTDGVVTPAVVNA